MKLTEIADFEVTHDKLSWPWIAFEATGRRFAFAASRSRIASRQLTGGLVEDGPSFSLPTDLALPTAAPPAEAARDAREGIHAFAIDPRAQRIAVTAVVDDKSVLATIGADGSEHRSELDTLAGAGFIGQAVAFDRSGARLWISAESEGETAILLVEAQTHAALGIVRSPALPPPAVHELYVHPVEDAVLLLAACGQDGTFARVARWTGGTLQAKRTAMEGGSIPAGMVGYSADGARVYLAEADEIRTHDFPGLKEIASTPFDGDFVSSYSGAVIGERVLVDGEDSENREDAVMMFDRNVTKGAFLTPAPAGMWAGRLGTDVIVLVASKGDPAQGRVLRVTLP